MIQWSQSCWCNYVLNFLGPANKKKHSKKSSFNIYVWSIYREQRNRVVKSSGRCVACRTTDREWETVRHLSCNDVMLTNKIPFSNKRYNSVLLSCLLHVSNVLFSSSGKHYCTRWFKYDQDWFVCKQVAQLLRSAACLHTNQSRSYLNYLVHAVLCGMFFVHSCKQSRRAEDVLDHPSTC